jgi:hypothetical protein
MIIQIADNMTFKNLQNYNYLEIHIPLITGIIINYFDFFLLTQRTENPFCLLLRVV